MAGGSMPQRASLHCLIAASLLPQRNPNVHWGPDAYLTLLENQLLELSLPAHSTAKAR